MSGNRIQQEAVGPVFDRPLYRRPCRRELGITSQQHRHLVPAARQDRLRVAFQVPALNDAGVECPFGDPIRDVGCVASTEAVHARPGRDVQQPFVSIAVRQRHVPREPLGISGGALEGRFVALAEKDGEVGALGEPSEERRLVLHGMARDDRDAAAHAAFASRSITRSKRAHCFRVSAFAV